MPKKTGRGIGGSLVLAAALVVILGAAIGYSFHVWRGIGAGGMNGNGTAALAIGAIGSLVLGGGLMALVFFSSRRGYDEAADLKVRSPTDTNE